MATGPAGVLDFFRVTDGGHAKIDDAEGKRGFLATENWTESRPPICKTVSRFPKAAVLRNRINSLR